MSEYARLTRAHIEVDTNKQTHTLDMADIEPERVAQKVAQFLGEWGAAAGLMSELDELARAWKAVGDASIGVLDLNRRDYGAGELTMIARCADDLRAVLDRHGAQ